ncbi:MAG: hypothetical protein AAGL24_06885 [Pseudomonadota bacterium]
MNWLDLNRQAQQRGDGLTPKLAELLEREAEAAMACGDRVTFLGDYSSARANIAGPALKGDLANADLTNVVQLRFPIKEPDKDIP